MERLATDAKRGEARRRTRRADGEVARLNSFLRSNLTFSLEGDVWREWSPDSPGGPPCPAGAPVRGTLTVATPGGAKRTTASVVAGGWSRRGRLLAIAGCLAECAMTLGLGAGVYDACGDRKANEMP